MSRIWLPVAVCLVLIAITVVAQDWGMAFVWVVVLVIGVLFSRRKARRRAATVKAMDTSWHKSMRRIIGDPDEPIDENRWTEPRIGLIRRGALARRYVWVVREDDQWSYLLSESDEASKRVDLAYVDNTEAMQAACRAWDVGWLPTGAYADAVWLHRLSGRIKSRRMESS